MLLTKKQLKLEFSTLKIMINGDFEEEITLLATYDSEEEMEENDNGLDSMIQFKDICIKNKKKIPIKRYKEIKEIVEYNRIDCKVLEEIVELLREIYV